MLVFPAASRPGRAFAALSLAIACALPAAAQVSPSDLGDLSRLRARATQQESPADVVALEGPVDPATYVVGVGDVFGLSIGGAVPVQLAIPVAADGGLVIPDAGTIPAAERTLADVLADVRAALRRGYRNVVTEVALVQPAPFLVHVGGAVLVPGRHPLPPMARAEDAVAAALDGISPRDAFADETAAGLRPALRSILLTHLNGQTETVDLHAYYLTGDPAFNPVLRGGDRLTVPVFDRARAVAVEGAAPFAGPFDLRPGDTAADLLRLAAGPTGVEALGSVQLARLTPEGDTRIMPLSPEATTDPTASVVLQPRDRIIVAPVDRLRGTVEVEGEVAFPGGYPIKAGRTTLADLLALAGGFTPEALQRAVYVERRGKEEPREQAPQSGAPVTSQLQEQLELAKETSEAAGRSDLPFSGRQFLATEQGRPARLVVDLSGGTDAASALYLREGDRVVVPEDPGGVRVTGQVVRPGIYPFAPGADAAYYVDQAGGQAEGARAVYVRDVASGALRGAGGAAVQQGDLVFVDRMPVGDTAAEQQLIFQENRERTEQRYRFAQIAVSVLVPALTTYLILNQNPNR